MKSNEIHVGTHYITRVADKLTVVNIQSYDPVKGWEVYNTSSGKTFHIKAACRFLRIATNYEVVNSRTRESLYLSMQRPVEGCKNFGVQCSGSEEMLKALDRPRKCMPGSPFKVLPGQKVAGLDDIIRRLKAGVSPPHTEPVVLTNMQKLLRHYQPSNEASVVMADVIIDLLKESSLQDVQADTGLSEERCKEIMAIGKMLFDNAK